MFIHTSSDYMAFPLEYYFFVLNSVIIYHHFVTSMVSLINCSSYKFHFIYSMLYVI